MTKRNGPTTRRTRNALRKVARITLSGLGLQSRRITRVAYMIRQRGGACRRTDPRVSKEEARWTRFRVLSLFLHARKVILPATVSTSSFRVSLRLQKISQDSLSSRWSSGHTLSYVARLFFYTFLPSSLPSFFLPLSSSALSNGIASRSTQQCGVTTMRHRPFPARVPPPFSPVIKYNLCRDSRVHYDCAQRDLRPSRNALYVLVTRA